MQLDGNVSGKGGQHLTAYRSPVLTSAVSSSLKSQSREGGRRLTIFGELSANRKTPSETAAMVVSALTYADAPGEDAYLHDELIWCDDTRTATTTRSTR